jgi:hypothetical protein
MTRPLPLLLSLLLTAPAAAQEWTTTTNVVRHRAESCILKIDEKEFSNICTQFAVTAGKELIGFWFENRAETHGFGFLAPYGQKPDRDGDIYITGIAVLLGDERYSYQGEGLCRIASPVITSCTFTPYNMNARYTAGAAHPAIR